MNLISNRIFFWVMLCTVPLLAIYAQPPQNPAAEMPRVRREADPGDVENAKDEGYENLKRALRATPLRRQKQAGPSPAQATMIAENCQWGMPKAQTGVDVGPTRLVVREGYVLEHSSLDKIPLWVCEHSTKAEVTGNAPRQNPFKADPQLKGHPRAELSDYKGSGHDRGHMAPAGNQTVDQRLKDETFFLSNMAPQVGPTFNQGIWRELEEQVRSWTEELGETWIVTGNMFYDPLEDDPTTADGIIPYSTVGANEVAVPTHCYKIIVGKDRTGQWQSVAYVIENKTHGRPYVIEDYITTVKWIEERTGLDFFPDLVTAGPGLADQIETSRGSALVQ